MGGPWWVLFNSKQKCKGRFGWYHSSKSVGMFLFEWSQYIGWSAGWIDLRDCVGKGSSFRCCNVVLRVYCSWVTVAWSQGGRPECFLELCSYGWMSCLLGQTMAESHGRASGRSCVAPRSCHANNSTEYRPSGNLLLYWL